MGLTLVRLGRHPEALVELERVAASLRRVGGNPVPFAMTERAIGGTLGHTG